MIKLLGKFLQNERGTTAIEYGLIAVGISVAIIVAVNSIGTNTKERFETVLDQVSNGN